MNRRFVNNYVDEVDETIILLNTSLEEELGGVISVGREGKECLPYIVSRGSAFSNAERCGLGIQLNVGHFGYSIPKVESVCF
jgi:hypothetical protein